MNYVNRKYKDTLFRALFSERKHLLSLYNAVNETNYTNEEDLEINTLENVIYLKMKNDISFLFGFSLNLYEHQSSVNPNMPLRDLFYVADLLQKIVKDRNLYSSSLVGIPTPKFVMFYNGTDEEAAQMEIAEAVNRAVDECIAEGVLADFLSEHRAEAAAMSADVYDEEKHRKTEDQNRYALGLQEGKTMERQIGIELLREAYREMGLSEEEAERKAAEKYREQPDTKHGGTK